MWINLHDGTYNLKKEDVINSPKEDFYAKHIAENTLSIVG